jgi:DNA polymerase/3'-5' exonuclease PolX
MPESEVKRMVEMAGPLRDEWVKKMNGMGKTDAAKILKRIEELIPQMAR